MKNKLLSGMLQKMNAGQNSETSAVEFENLNDSLAAKIKGGLSESINGNNASSCNESGCNASSCTAQQESALTPVLI